MTGHINNLKVIQKKIWQGTVPLEIRLAANDVAATAEGVEGYHVNCPRLKYLPLILDQLHSFYAPHLRDVAVEPHQGWFSVEGVPLKWHFPVGLLFDLYSGSVGHSASPQDSERKILDRDPYLPWKLELHFSDWPTDQLPPLDRDGRIVRDAFTNNMKEASFLRSGQAKVAMALPMQDFNALWESVTKTDLSIFKPVQTKLIHPIGVANPLRHIPLRIYLPSQPSEEDEDQAAIDAAPAQGRLRVLQTLITPQIGSRQAQTLGTALNTMLPTLFPSRRMPVLAQPILHGSVAPLGIGLEELSEYAAYADGWLHINIIMIESG